ncbi:MAG: caspase family protein [Cyanobacteria bacterium J06642_11]
MGKHILLIGVETGRGPSPAIANVTALQQTLLAEVEELRDDQVTVLINPDLSQLRHNIALMSYRCRRGDVCLIYYTGYGVMSTDGSFYLPAQDTDFTRLTTTALSSDYIRQALPSTKENVQRVMILDCLWQTTPVGTRPEKAKTQDLGDLADCNCTLLTARGSLSHPWPITDLGISLYTQWLMEGITTGLADMDADGGISVNDIHTYVKHSLEEANVALWPMMVHGGNHDIHEPLMLVKRYSPEREYRRSLEGYAHRHRGNIPMDCRNVLEFLRHQLGLTVHQSQAIEVEVMAPYADHKDNCDRYRQALATALALENPLGQPLKKWLRHLQGELALSYEDICAIENQLLPQAAYPQFTQLIPAEQPKLPGRADPSRYTA